MTTFTHSGPWNDHSRQSRALSFIEKYLLTTSSLALGSIPFSTFFSPAAVYRDTQGNVFVGGERIWNWLQRLLPPFSKIENEVVEVRVVVDAEGRDVVFGELLTHFWLKGEEDELIAPRFFVWTLGTEAQAGTGTDGLQFEEVRVFWDTAIIGRFVSEKRKEAKKRKLEDSL